MPELGFLLKRYFGILTIMRHKFLLFLPLLPLLFTSFGLFALTREANNYHELSQKSELILHLVIREKKTATREDPASKKMIPVDCYQADILEVIKGELSGKDFSFCQLGGTQQERSRLGFQYYFAPPVYPVDQEYLLFLRSENSMGLRFPVGHLGEGSFVIQKDSEGNKTIVNPYNNEGLFSDGEGSGVSKGKTMGGGQKGPISFDTFKELIR